MSHTVNDLTGAVTVTVAGETLTLRAHLVAMAAFQGEMSVVGIGVVEVMLEECDPRAILAGLRHLVVEGDRQKVIDTVTAKDFQALSMAILDALKVGLPKPDPKADDSDQEEGGSARAGKRAKTAGSTGT